LSKKKVLKREDSALTHLQVIQEALQTPQANVPDNKPRPPTKESSGMGAPKSMSAPGVVEPQIVQRTHPNMNSTIKEIVDPPAAIEQLICQTINNPILHKGFRIYKQTNHIQEHVENLTHKSLHIEAEYGDLLFATQNLHTCQQELNIELRDFSEQPA
jgi:hypothetical protein